MSKTSSASTAWPAARPTGISPIQHPAWEEARNAVLDLAAAGPVTAIVVGEPGTGKTWLLRELASALGDHGFPTMMLMQGDLPMALSAGAALLVDEASLMSATMRAQLSTQQHGVVVLAATEWVEDGSDPASPGPVIITLRLLEPDEAAEVAAEWLHRSDLPAQMIDAAELSRLTAESGGKIGTLVRLLGAAAKAWRQPRIAPAPAASPPPPATAPVEPPILPPVLAVDPRRRSVYRPVLGGAAIAAMIALGWALKPVPPPRVAQLASTGTAEPPPSAIDLADASPAAPAPLAPVRPIDPAASPAPMGPSEPTPSAVLAPAHPLETAALAPVEPDEPAPSTALASARPAEPAASGALTSAGLVEPAPSAAPASAGSAEPIASAAPAPVHAAAPAASAAITPARQVESAASAALPPVQPAEPADPARTVVADAVAPGPVASVAASLPPLRSADTPDPAVVTASSPAQFSAAAPMLASLPPTPELNAAAATPGAVPVARAPAVASALPPPVLRPSAPSLVNTLEDPTATPIAPKQTSPTATGGPGLVLLAQRGDTLESLYGSVYRDRNAPPFAAVMAANPRPLRPGAIVVFPEPPGGWKRAQR